MNVNFNPGINLPTLTINYGNYKKESGENFDFDSQSLDYDSQNDCEYNDGVWENDECYSNYDIDTRIKTTTHNFSSYVTHNFKLFNMKHNFGLSFYKSKKDDELYDELSDNSDYLSPQSNSQNINFTVKTNIKEKLSTDFYLSHSYFDFSQKSSVYYQEQDIISCRIGTQFKNNKIIDNIGAWIDFSKGDGTSDYNQYGLKMLINLKLYEDLFMNFHFRNYVKEITPNNTDSTSGNYSNTIIKANLSYKF